MPYSRLATPRATRELLEQHGLWTRKSLGQHFLVDDNIVGRILDLAALDGEETVLEVGPGIGTLTIALCERASHVVAIEADRRLADVLDQTASHCGNLTVVMGDALKVTVPRPVDAFVANLPYGVAATLVLRYFEELDTMRSATVMVQAEVADRMSASPGTKDYGSYTVKLQLRARAGESFTVPRSSFMPPPRVDSRVIRLDRRDDGPETSLLEAASRVADAAFSQRRKTLRNSLSAGLSARPDTVEQVLHDAGVDPGSRAETHEPQTFLTMGSFARKHGLLP